MKKGPKKELPADPWLRQRLEMCDSKLQNLRERFAECAHLGKSSPQEREAVTGELETLLFEFDELWQDLLRGVDWHVPTTQVAAMRQLDRCLMAESLVALPRKYADAFAFLTSTEGSRSVACRIKTCQVAIGILTEQSKRLSHTTDSSRPKLWHHLNPNRFSGLN